MPATTRDGQFARQLRRAAAQRGRLEPVYQQLSDHWTLILQRLYPVWALIGPGLPQWVTGAEAGAYLRRLFGERLPPEFGTFVPPPRRPTPAADREQSGCMIAAKVLAVIIAIAIAMMAALILLLYGLCGGFR